MKKSLLTIITALIITGAGAQQVSNATMPSAGILPEAGDWSIGFDVVPIIKTAGNLFHTPTGNDSIYSEKQFTLVGLYVKNDKTYYRAKLRIGFGSAKYNNLVTNDVNPTAQLTDTWTESGMNITLGGGIQKIKGKGRLRGIYGWEAAVTLGSHGHSYTYGNPYTTTNQTPTSTDFNQPIAGGGFTATAATSRPTDISDGFLLGFQLNGFIGAEFFVAPKMSLSAEYGWGLMYNSIGQATTSTETWTGGSGGNVDEVNSQIAQSHAFSVDVINATSIIFHLYF